MTARLVLVLACLFGAISVAAPKLTRLEWGQKLFREGDFDGALRVLDGAVSEGGDNSTMEKVHLLRARCFAARQDFSHAEEALAHALDFNPAAELDPAKVDPTLVKMLDAVRKRLTGTVQAASQPPGAKLKVDGKDSGEAPRAVEISVGKHTVAAQWGDGPETSAQVLVPPHRDVYVSFVQGEGSGGGPVTLPQDKKWHILGDLRGSLEVPSVQNAPLRYGLELGAGLERGFFRLGLSVRLFPYFGVTPRGALVVPVMDKLSVYLEVSLPVWFLANGIGLGVEGAGGAEFHFLKWFGVYGQVGGEHLFLYPYLDPTRFVATAGVRLRVP